MDVTYLNVRCVFLMLWVLPAVHGRNTITCAEGEVNSSNYVVAYTVEKKEISIESGCQFENYSSLWPGKPEHLKVNQSGRTVQITWSPCDDGSISYLAGFLIEVYDEDTSIYNIDPEICYTVTLSTSLKNAVTEQTRRPFAQDAVFSMKCVVHGNKATPYRVFLTPLPMPLSYTSMDIDVGFYYSAYVSSTKGRKSLETDDIVEGIRGNGAAHFLEKDDLLKLVAICAGCFCLVVINAILIFMMCRPKRFRGSGGHVAQTSAAVRLLENGDISVT